MDGQHSAFNMKANFVSAIGTWEPFEWSEAHASGRGHDGHGKGGGNVMLALPDNHVQFEVIAPAKSVSTAPT